MIFYNLERNFMEFETRIFNFISPTGETDIVEQQYIMTARIVMKFQIGLK